jgi:predicted glutamine amidotransferase
MNDLNNLNGAKSMCIIIYKPAGTKISKTDVNNMWNTNPHGAGIAVPNKHKVEVIKGIMQRDELEYLLNQCDNTALILHMRIATHGSITPTNTHPFPCGKNRVLFHNGVLEHFGVHGTNEESISDSRHLAEDLAQLLYPAAKRILNTIADSTRNKFILIQDNIITFHGDFTEYKNLRCSNLHFIPIVTSFKTTKVSWNDWNTQGKTWRDINGKWWKE